MDGDTAAKVVDGARGGRRGSRIRGLLSGVAAVLVFAAAGPVAASLGVPAGRAGLSAVAAAPALELAGKVEGHSSNKRRGSSAEIYGGSSADRYGGSSADEQGRAGKIDRRVHGKPKNVDPGKEAKKKPESDEARQDREDREEGE